MTHYHDVTLTEIDYICNTLFSKNDRHDATRTCQSQQLRQCIIHLYLDEPRIFQKADLQNSVFAVAMISLRALCVRV